jgi:hypothetical protein
MRPGRPSCAKRPSRGGGGGTPASLNPSGYHRFALGRKQYKPFGGVPHPQLARPSRRRRADPATPASIRLEARIARLGTTSTTTEIDVVRDGEVLVEGRLRHVFLDPKTWQKTEIPDWVREGLTPYLAAS